MASILTPKPTDIFCVFCGKKKQYLTRLVSGEIICKECYEEISLKVGERSTTWEREKKRAAGDDA